MTRTPHTRPPATCPFPRHAFLRQWMNFLANLLRGSANMTAKPHALEFVKGKIEGNKVVVFSKTYCPYCIKAKKALGTLIQPSQMEVIELDAISGSPTCIEIQDALNEVCGGRSVPRVFIGGNFIGGGDDTAAKQASGELATLLKAVGLP